MGKEGERVCGERGGPDAEQDAGGVSYGFVVLVGGVERVEETELGEESGLEEEAVLRDAVDDEKRQY